MASTPLWSIADVSHSSEDFVSPNFLKHLQVIAATWHYPIFLISHPQLSQLSRLVRHPMSNAWCLAQSNSSPIARASDAQACIQSCQQQFLQLLAPINGALPTVCEALSDVHNQTATEAIRMLYCCDSTLCGVETLHNKDQDRKSISLGFHDIDIPAPPNTRDGCSCVSSSMHQSATQQPIMTFSPSQSSLPEPAETPAGNVQGPAEVTSSGHATFFTAQSTASPVTHSATYPTAGARPNQGASGKSTITIAVAAAISAVVGVSMMVAFAMWFLRRRRRPSSPSSVASRGNSQDDPPVPGSPTPLVSPVGSPASPEDSTLVPPRRLRERKLLIIKGSPTQMQDNRENQWLEHPGPYNHSSPAASTDRILPCQIPLTSKHQESHWESKRNTFGHQISPKEPRVPVDSPPASSNFGFGLSREVKPASASEDAASISHAGPRRFHLPSQVSGLTRPGPPPNQRLPAMPDDAYHGSSSMPITRYGGPGFNDASQFSRQVGSPIEFHKSFGSMREHLVKPPPIRLEPVPENSKALPASPGSPVIGEGELERLGGSYK
ncbi:hypothetical protein HIM_00315 [Hirsutella minnesotensis 3608]|nr:hypothetical protein HIM_00315 [Hirsutella minnesotensis 3608]